MHNIMVYGAEKDHNLRLRERLKFLLIFFTFVKVALVLGFINCLYGMLYYFGMLYP